MTPKYHGPDPVVEITGVTEIARDLVVVPNRHIDLVPNIGVIGGTHSVLIVETGMGPSNAAKVLEFAADYAKGRHLYLTTTHFHPEHAFGAQAFAGEATYLANRAQADDLAARGAGYLDGAAWADPALTGRDLSLAIITALVSQEVSGMANPFVHVELLSTDRDRARSFYGEVFDWDFTEVPRTDSPYIWLDTGGNPSANIIESPIAGEDGPFWLPYVRVDDLRATLGAVRSRGGTVVRELEEVSGMGSFAIVRDPLGATLGLLQPPEGPLEG